jgi:hypothetical protein
MSHDQQLRVFPSLLIGLGLCGFLISFAISFQSAGLGQGLEIGDAELQRYRIQHGEEANRFSGAVQNTHQRMASDYMAISVSFFLIAAIAVVQILSGHLRQIVFPLLSIVAAAVAANFLRILIRDKTGVEDSFYEAPRNAFVKLTITYDWFFLILAAAAVLINLFFVNRAIGTKPTR